MPRYVRSARGLADRVLATIAVLVVAFISMSVVAIFKKTGQMSVIESQSMDMTKITPPAGATPVAVARAHVESLSGSVTYTGTVRAFNEDPIYPRIQARITRMFVYPGDHVHAGQVLASMDNDNSEYALRAREASYKALAGKHAIEIARQEFEQKSQEAEAASAQRQAAEQNLNSADADLEYWKTEIAREKVLLEKSVISKQEYDAELAKSRQAEAKVEADKAELTAAVRKAAAAKEASLGMYQHIHHNKEEWQALSAAADAANTVASYTKLTAPASGVVTIRDVNPGVVVNPGTRIMRIDEIDKVRVQAQVAGTDIARIQVGAPVRIKSDGLEQPISASVTARFPAADPASRTSTVECLVDNAGEKLLPGQYVVMDISTGNRQAVTVPSAAVMKNGEKTQVWKAVGEQGAKTAILTDVRTGLANADRTEILSGIREGDLVIYRGQSGLLPNSSVFAVDWTEDGPARMLTGQEVASNRLSELNKWRLQQKLKDITMTSYMLPVPPKGDHNQMFVELATVDHKPVAGARLAAKTDMPTMSMPGPDLQAKEVAPGRYEFDGDFMSTLWNVDLTISLPAGTTHQIKLEVDVP